jgi:hypothetical protein
LKKLSFISQKPYTMLAEMQNGMDILGPTLVAPQVVKYSFNI